MKKFESILIIDDDEASHFVCEKIIQFLGISNDVTHTINGEEALQHLSRTFLEQRRYPELILLDLDMPVMNGFNFIEKFNKLNINRDYTKLVILATTSSHTSKIETIKKLGLKYYISKPMELSKMKKLCEHMESEKNNDFVLL
jgi:CheY-like chemotaxis protein